LEIERESFENQTAAIQVIKEELNNEATEIFDSYPNNDNKNLELLKQGRLSLGEAAELAGISKRTFIELLGSYGVSVFNYHPKEIARMHGEDFQNA